MIGGVTFLERKRINIACILIFTFILLQFCNLSIKSYMEHLSGQELDNQYPMVSWVVMGMTENDENCDGWYNGYVAQNLIDSEYDGLIAAENAKKDLKNLLEYYMNNPERFIRFLFKKNLSQWNEPTFESLCSLQDRGSSISEGKIQKLFLSVDNYIFLSNIYNIFNLGILFFTFVALISKWKQFTWYTLFLPLVFVGGFIFHFFWEAGSRYTISYFVLLFPTAVIGFHNTIQKAEYFMKNGNTEWFSFQKTGKMGIFVIGIIMVLFSCEKVIRKIDSEEEYKNYLSEVKSLPTGGRYLIESVSNHEVYDVILESMGYNFQIRMPEEESYLIVLAKASQRKVRFGDRMSCESERWYLEGTGNGTYMIRYKHYMLAIADGVFSLEQYDPENPEEWYLHEK